MDDNKTYDSIILGEYLASYASRKGFVVNHTKLQKLLYILYGSYFTLHGYAIANELPKAWPYGPVFPRVQKKFAKSNDFMTADLSCERFEDIRANTNLNTLIDNVLSTFGSWSAQALSEWSHKAGSPWSIALANNGNVFNAVISTDLLKDYFTKIMNIPSNE